MPKTHFLCPNCKEKLPDFINATRKVSQGGQASLVIRNGVHVDMFDEVCDETMCEMFIFRCGECGKDFVISPDHSSLTPYKEN